MSHRKYRKPLEGRESTFIGKRETKISNTLLLKKKKGERRYRKRLTSLRKYRNPQLNTNKIRKINKKCFAIKMTREDMRTTHPMQKI